MPDTTIRVKDETHKAIVKTRGAFEQTFGIKLSLDDAMYLAACYINIAYEELQNLRREDLVHIETEKDGSFSIRFSGMDKITAKVFPRLLEAFENFKKMVKDKEKIEQVTVGA